MDADVERPCLFAEEKIVAGSACVMLPAAID